ncbi:MAG: TetR family transcriptional regulator, partial [Bacillota bacterium]|nr:TetR family transcriptional regulator [Bacillota bacterium]
MRNVTTDRSYVLQSNPRLLDATLDEFASRDFEAASLNEILKQSGFNKGSFYYRFAEKYELYAALLETVFARHAELLDYDSRSIVDTRGVATGLSAMISSLYRLGDLDHRYLALYARLYDELATVHPNLKLLLGNSPIERLIHSLRSLLSESSPSHESTRFFGNLAQMTLYHLDRVARIDGVWTEPMKIAQAMIQSAYEGENVGLERIIKFGTVDVDSMGGQTPTDKIDFVISSGEIVALVGRDSGKSNLGDLINGILGPRFDEARVISPTLVELGSKGTAMIPAGIKLNRT